MPSLKNCKFGTECTNDACKFLHPDGKKAVETKKDTNAESANADAAKPEPKTVPDCKHGANCTYKNCKFKHPEADASKAEGKAKGKRKADFTVSELIDACPALADAIIACPALADALAAARVAAEATRRANALVKQISKSS